VQKIEFLQEDTGTAVPPGDAELQQYFGSHQSRYLTPATVSFAHIYFSADERGDNTARARAQTELKRQHAADAPRLAGDPFPEGTRFEAISESSAISVFGDSPFSQALFSAPEGEWAGPFRSAFGWHLLRVSRRDPPHVPEFETVKDRVLADYVADARERANAEEFRRLASKYQVLTEAST
jgi:parvulin-like peptidyl-prolyl isomerase